MQQTLGFNSPDAPVGVAVDLAGDVFVADEGNSRLLELTPSGVQQMIAFTAPTPGSGPGMPAWVALDSSEYVYFSGIDLAG